MSEFLELFGSKIREIRKAKGLTQEELAERCGLQNTYIGGIERGERNISLQSVDKLAEGLEVIPFELFKFDDLSLYNLSNDKSKMITEQLRLIGSRSEEEVIFIQRMIKEILSLLDSQKKEGC
ncbi:helix-turn-helix domain-containing protein [Niallia taxi]|uniref:helix-turn-helix domain-containing protein n=1 Tax=Niallia taxi TaxID=2499688 RepID=UPI003D2ABB87